MLHDEVGQRIHIAEDMKIFMQFRDNPPDKEVVERYFTSSLTHYPEVKAIGYADKTNTVRYFYSLDAGLSQPGTDLSDISKYFDSTEMLTAEQEKTIAIYKKPAHMAEGTDILGLRVPLFVRERFDGTLWINFVAEKVFLKAIARAETGRIVDEPKKSYVEIFTEDGVSLYRLNQLAPNSYVREFSLPIAGTHWLIKTGWSRMPQPNPYIRGLIWGLGSCVLALILLLHNNLLRRSDWLNQAVTEKTEELLVKNKLVELEIQEHKDTAQALLKSEQRLAALLAAVPDKLLRVSREGKILDIEVKNPEDLYLPYAEMLNKNIVDFLPVDVSSKFVELGEKVLATGQMATAEYRLAIRGSTRDFEARLALSAEDEILVIIRDITEEKQDEACEHLLMQISAKVLGETSIEEVLNYTCEQMVTIFDISLARVFLKADDNTIKISAAAGKLSIKDVDSGLSCREHGQLSGLAIQTGMLQVIQYKERLSPWQEKLMNIVAVDKSEIQSEIALPLKLRDSTAGAFYLISNKPHYWDERIVARLQRFSDQMAIAISAARDRQQLKLLIAGLEAAANAIVITDKDGNIAWINPAFNTLTGYTEAEALGQNLMLLSGYQDEPFRQRFWQQLSLAGEAWKGELAHHRKDGSIYEEIITITPVRNNFDVIANFIVIKEDITEQKMAAAAMKKANAIRAQAEKLSSLGTMAAGLSHEINQPLNSIKMIASGMVYAYNNGKERSAADIMRNVEEISNQADRINNIIMHMRSFIRRDNSQVTYCDVNQAVEQSLKIIGSQLITHGVNVQTHLAEELPLICATPTALEELVVNLSSNAMQAMDSAVCQDKQLVIRTWADGDTVNIEISDSGPGIAANHRTKIFEPFFSTKPGGDNLGLGLSIVQSIVTSCQGTIKVVSGENEGAAFLITLPGISNIA